MLRVGALLGLLGQQARGFKSANILARRSISVMAKKTAAFGSWKSPVSAESLTEATVGLAGVRGASDGSVWWLEARPSEAGRCVVVRRDKDGTIADHSDADSYVRTRVHEYGGGAWLLADRGPEKVELIYSNLDDQRLYVQRDGSRVPLTAETENCAVRYADGAVDKQRDLLYCVRETHLKEHDVVNEIVAVKLDGSFETVVVATGAEFYAAPRLSPDGKQLAFIEWSHPNMPWDATKLRVVSLDEEGGGSTVVAGADEDTSVLQPAWSPSGALHYISDESGFYNLYKQGEGCILSMEVDFGGAAPGWGLGQQGYDFDAEGRVLATYVDKTRGGVLVVIGDTVEEHCGGVLPRGISEPRSSGGWVYFSASSPSAPSAVARWNGAVEVLKKSTDKPPLAEGFVSQPELVEFDSTDGGKAYAHYYAPKNADYTSDGLPPLLVKAHGGPTACASTAYSLAIQFWTSRGFAVVDVDYRGSTGYGRDFRRSLRLKWGVYDVDDCCAAATALVDRKLARPDQLAIEGGSAGGYTVLGALAWKDVFAAGCSKYGIGDLAVLAADTHKFESRYLDRLVGKWPEEAALYKERAPIEAVDQLSCPVLLLQGADDKIVPPNQALMMHEALKNKGIPTAVKIYEGEAHGFRKAENIHDALNSELYFFSKVFGFEAGDENLPAFKIDNLE